MATQYDIVRLERVESTQDDARRMLETHQRPVLVVADRQFLGRGRQGRQWLQPDRGMFASYGFVSDWTGDHATLIPLVAAVAMYSAVFEIFGVEVGLRWPNDLMTDSGKVGGILVEASSGDVVIGCGMNVWWRHPITGAASLVSDDPGREVPQALAEVWARNLSDYIAEGGDAWPRTEYEAASVTLGGRVFWGDESGDAVEIAPNGALVVETNGARVFIHAGEVHTHDGH